MTNNLKRLNEPVSVVIPYSPKHTPRPMLEEAKQSVFKQSVETEIIVVVDKNQNGPAWARNTGLNKAETRFVAFLDADDIWLDDKLARQLCLMEMYSAGLCVEGKNRGTESFIRDILAGDLSSVMSSALIDTEQVTAQFDNSLVRREDHLFLIEAAAQADVCLCQDLFKVRKHSDGLSSRDTASLLEAGGKDFITAACESVDGIERYLDEYYAEFYHRKGRSKYYNRQFIPSSCDLLLSILIKPRCKTIAALLVNFLLMMVHFVIRRRSAH